MSDDGYEYRKGTFRYKKGSTPDRSRETDGAWRGTTRDADGNLVGHGEFIPSDDDDYDTDDAYSPEYVSDYVRYETSPVPSRSTGVEVASESAPDIAKLVPIALVAVAGIAAGVAGVKVAQNRKRRRDYERISIAAQTSTPSAAPAGWYETAGDPARLRYWNGFAWTDDYAQRAVSAPRIDADWYPDPSNAAQLRYWDGSAWTHHVSPAPGAVTTPADWYPDPSNPAQLRYWDGSAWTSHITNGSGAAVGLQQSYANTSGSELAPAHAEPKINMSSAEWKAHVEAWLRVGAVQQELWRRLSNAHIQDADAATLEAQRRMEALSPEEGARRIQWMLEANPALREQGSLLDFMRLFSGIPGAPLGIETNHWRERSR
jgi:hypothetical protein